jgi:hypothetical protein
MPCIEQWLEKKKKSLPIDWSIIRLAHKGHMAHNILPDCTSTDERALREVQKPHGEH